MEAGEVASLADSRGYCIFGPESRRRRPHEGIVRAVHVPSVEEPVRYIAGSESGGAVVSKADCL